MIFSLLKKNKLQAWAWAAFVFCFIIITIRIIFVPLYDADKARDSIHGDAYSDINTHSAVKYFYDYGFYKSYFLPVHGYAGNGDTTKASAYTHYPALPDILAGIYAHIVHSTDQRLLRIFPALISAAFFFFIFYFYKKILPDSESAWIGALLLVTSNYFIFWADNLHKHLYEEAVKWVFVFCLYCYYNDAKKNKGWLLASALLFIVATNISFEPVTYMAVVTVGFSWVYQKKIFSLENIFLGMMPFIGFGIHFCQNILYFGSFDAALADMTHAATLRTVGNESAQNELKRNLSWVDFLTIPLSWMQRIERFFLIPGPAFVALAYMGLSKLKTESVKIFQLSMVLLFATVSWNIAMTQHSIVHVFTTKHIGIFYGLAAGYGVKWYYEYLSKNWIEKHWPEKCAHVLFIAYCLGMALSQQIFDYWRYAILFLFN